MQGVQLCTAWVVKCVWHRSAVTKIRLVADCCEWIVYTCIHNHWEPM